MTVRTALYLRISEDRTGEGLALERQEADCRALCAAKGWVIVVVYAETASGTNGTRREFERLRADIDAGLIDAVVCWDLDRLTRKPVELEWLVERGERHGLRLASVADDYDLSTDAGRLFARIKAAVARGEVERKSARQAAALRQAVAAGKPTGGRRAFGYTADHMHLHPVEAPLAAELFERWNAGATLGDLRRWLNGAGVRTVAGNEWTTGTLANLIKNPRYAGLRGVKWQARDDKGRPVLSSKGRPRRQRLHTVEGRAAWPAIVDEQVWRQALDRITDPARAQHHAGRDRKYLLSGLARCAATECGKPLKTHINNQAPDHPGYRSLRCPGFRHTNRRASEIEDYVEAVVFEQLSRLDLANLLHPATPTVDLRGLRSEADAIRGRMRSLARQEVLGQRSADEVTAAREAANERLEEISQELARAGRSDALVKFLDVDPEEVWQGLTLAQKQDVIDTLMTVRVGPGRAGRRPKNADEEPPVNVYIDLKR